jgi:hypothetical protein
MAQIEESSGVLVVRAWVEGNAPDGLRARITQLPGLDENQSEVTAASQEQILAIVRAWLRTLLAEAQLPPTASGSAPGELHERQSRKWES